MPVGLYVYLLVGHVCCVVCELPPASCTVRTSRILSAANPITSYFRMFPECRTYPCGGAPKPGDPGPSHVIGKSRIAWIFASWSSSAHGFEFPLRPPMLQT